MQFNSAKNLGGIGALMMFVGVLPYVSTYSYGILELLGGIFLLIAAKGLADYYQEGGIFTNALYGVIASIVGVVAFVGTLVYAVLNLLGDLGSFGLGNLGSLDFSQFSQIDWTNFATSVLSNLGGFLGTFILAFVVLFVFIVIAAVFYRKSMGLTSKRSGVGLFSTAGIFLLVGAILTILVIGLLLVWISLLLIAIAFFQLKPSQSAQPTYYPPPPPA
jgi:uncharacterized membrane protein